MKATLFQSAADTSNFDKYPRDEAVPADELSGWDKEFWIYTRGENIYQWSDTQGTNLVLGPPEKFYHRNPSETFRDTHWYHLDNPKKVPGAPSKGFLIFLGFDRNITKTENWL